MELFNAIEVPLEEDLRPLSALLQERGVPHRIVENAGRQVLQVADRGHIAPIEALYRQWRAGEVTIELARRPRTASASAEVVFWRAAPVTLVLAVVSIVVFLLTYVLGWRELEYLLHFLPLIPENGRLVQGEMGSQYWRLVTPAFLHFSWLHIVFNCLWLWDLGRRMEVFIGHFNMLMLCLFIAATSNACQAVYGHFGLFGGMSGVVYGLLAFSWVAPLLQPAWPLQPPRAVMIMMLVWLVLCMVGVIGGIANAAHVSGLLLGGVLGALFGALSRYGGHGAGAQGRDRD